MRPEYTRIIEMGKQDGGTLSTGTSIPFRRTVEAIARKDDVRIAQLVFEGLTRVLADRYTGGNSDEYLAELQGPLCDEDAIQALALLQDFDK